MRPHVGNELRVEAGRPKPGRAGRGSWLTRLFGRPVQTVEDTTELQRPTPAVAALFGPAAGQQPAPAAAIPELAFFHVDTCHGTRLLFDRSDGTMLHGDPAAPGAGPILACVPVDRPDICLLIAGEETRFALRLHNDPETGHVITLRISRADERTWSLAHPVRGLLVCAEAGGTVVANREAPGVWECFNLVPASGVSAASLSRLHNVARHLPAVASARAALQAIRSGENSQELRPLLRALRASDVEWLGRLLHRNLAACKALARIYPDDIWARLALPDLAAASMMAQDQAARNPPGFVREIDTSFDALAQFDGGGRWQSLPHACSIFARRDREPTRTVCALTTVRDEGLYLVEWLAYHRVLGVEGFFVYSNDLGDGSDELLRILAGAGILNWTSSVTTPGLSPQFKAYGHALQVMPEILDFRWAGFIDLDEFVVLNTELYRSIPAFLAARETAEVDAVALNWMPFGASSQLRRSDAPVIERFTMRDPAVNAHVKTFLRPHRFVHAMPHHPFPDRSVRPVFRSASGGEHPQSPFSPAPEDGHAFIAHYYSKSAEEHLLRRSMSRADLMLGTDVSPAMFGPANAQGFLDQRGRDQVPDHRLVRQLPAVREEMVRLRAIPGVEAVLAHVENRYRERLQRLGEMMAVDPRFQQPGTAERWFADLLHGQPTA